MRPLQQKMADRQMEIETAGVALTASSKSSLSAVARPEPECFFADPVFVLCNGRSGSTLLRFLLDAHPDLACPPETNLPDL
jgi:hypothetical protein